MTGEAPSRSENADDRWSVAVANWKRAVTAREPVRTYGRRERFGPYWKQAIRFVGRAMERLGARMDSWSWG